MQHLVVRLCCLNLGCLEQRGTFDCAAAPSTCVYTLSQTLAAGAPAHRALLAPSAKMWKVAWCISRAYGSYLVVLERLAGHRSDIFCSVTKPCIRT